MTATATSRGRKHVARGTPCEDAVDLVTTGEVVVAAVADGHGAHSMTRADRGAAFAVAAMVEALGDATVPVDDVPAALVRRWRDLVDADVLADPLPAGGEHAGDPRAHYGTTALGARVRRDGIDLVQLGDGDVVALTTGSALVTVSTPPPPWPGGTNSLRFDDAVEKVATHSIDTDDVRAVLLATDGVDKAHPIGWQATLVQDLARSAADGPDGLAAAAQRLTDAASITGADDATIATIAREAI